MQIEASPVKKIKVSDARSQLRLTQKRLSELAKVAPMVVSNAENGYTIRRLSAYAILDALNEQRKARGWLPLEFDAMDWKVQGDGE